jgi:hypothetical protein
VAAEEVVAPVEAAPPQASDRSERRPLESARRKTPPVAEPSTTSSTSGDADINTRTMGQLYEQQGLWAHASAVYERLLESDPGDAELSRHLDRLRQRVGAAPSKPSSTARVSRLDRDSGKVAPGSRSPGDDRRSPEPASGSGTELVEAESAPRDETPRKPVSALIHGSDSPVVPIESLAPDSPAAEVQGEAP